ncbi:hypothetical protein [Pseudonocardia alni]|uniref:hypothetical protein n=1 Tax=Pseudonocardia alni TaxID=33907 RepID=UPI001AD70DE1|nr:hypothetical protein [Pseudonocardia alni]MBO4238584.1 hypothetical protein [Pseudonocardia alni]
MAILDLLDDDVDLSPDRHIRADPEPLDTGAATARLRAAIAALPEPPRLRPAGDRTGHAVTTVGDLVKAGVLAVRQGPFRREEPAPQAGPGATLRMLTARDVHARRAATGRVPADSPGHVTLEPGDVVAVVPAVAGSGVVVVDDGGAVLGPRTQLLRPDRERLDPHYLAGVLWAAATVETRITGRSDIRRVAVPLLPIGTQRDVGEAFRNLWALETGLREVREAGLVLLRGSVQGLGAGSLEVDA